MHQEGDDRRRYPRSRRGVPAVLDESGPGVLNHVDNISGNGVLCHTVKPVPLMTRLRIHIELPNEARHRVDAEGVVVRCDPDESGDDHFRVAILFTRLDDASLRAIDEFVSLDLDDDGDGEED